MKRLRTMFASLLTTRALIVLCALGVLSASYLVFSAVRLNNDTSTIWTTTGDRYQEVERSSAAGGRITIIVSMPRSYGYRIGDVVPVRLTIIGDKRIHASFQTLEEGVVDVDGSDYELARPPRITEATRGSKRLWQVDLSVRTFKSGDSFTFSCNFLYATGTLPGGNPDWVRTSTPTVSIEYVNTLGPNQDLIMGDHKTKANSTGQSPLGQPLFVLGILLSALLPLAVVPLALRRLRRPKKVSAEQIAWRRFDAVIDQASSLRWEERHYAEIATALRTYLGVASFTTLEIEMQLGDHAQLDQILPALRLCDGVAYGRTKPSDTENHELIAAIAAIVPKP